MAVPGPPKLFHRFPFVLTDRGLDSRPDGSSASRLLSFDDSLGEGAPRSTYGQSLLVEAMAQTAALFAEGSERKQSGMLVGLRRVRFGRPPRMGDRLLVEASLAQKFGDLVRVVARVKVARCEKSPVDSGSSGAVEEGDHALVKVVGYEKSPVDSGSSGSVEEEDHALSLNADETLVEGEILISLAGGAEPARDAGDSGDRSMPAEGAQGSLQPGRERRLEDEVQPCERAPEAPPS